MSAERIAELLFKAHEANAQFQSSENPSPKDLEDTYQAQDLVYARLAKGARPVAWKVGGPGDELEPTIAPILPRRVLTSPARIAARNFHVIGVEAEIAFRFVRDLRDDDPPEEEIADAIGEAVVAIELCDSRLADWQSAPPLWKLADNQMNWGLVVGTGTARWRQIDFKAQRAELWIGGEQRVRAPVRQSVPPHALDHRAPCETRGRLARRRCRHDGKLGRDALRRCAR